MKKYLLSIAVAMIAAFTFIACDNDDDNNVMNLDKTTWQGQMVMFDVNANVTITFNDAKSGIQRAEGTMEYMGMTLPMKEYAKFNYIFDGNKGVATVTEMVVLLTTPMGDIDVTPKDVTVNAFPFQYDAAKQSIVIDDEEGVLGELKKINYSDIEYPKTN